MAEYEDEPLYLPLTPDTKPGTKLICVDDTGTSSICKDKIYILCYIEYDNDGDWMVHVREEPTTRVSGGWFIKRFKIV